MVLNERATASPSVNEFCALQNIGKWQYPTIRILCPVSRLVKESMKRDRTDARCNRIVQSLLYTQGYEITLKQRAPGIGNATNQDELGILFINGVPALRSLRLFFSQDLSTHS